MMSVFDKICAVPTIILGVLFMALGAVGVIGGSKANFTLPPILGGLPFFLGWAMCVGLIKYWRLSSRLKRANRPSIPSIPSSFSSSSSFSRPTDTVDQ